MQNNNSSEQIDPGAALPEEVKRTSAQSTAPRPLPEGTRAGAAAPVPESESFPGSFDRCSVFPVFYRLLQLGLYKHHYVQE